MLNKRTQAEGIAICTKTRNAAYHMRRDERLMSLCLSGEDIRKMNLDARQFYRSERICYGERCMGVRRRVDNDPIKRRLCILNPLHEFSLMVRLSAL